MLNHTAEHPNWYDVPAYLRRDPLRTLRLGFLVAFVLVGVTAVLQLHTMRSDSVGLGAAVVGAMILIRVAEYDQGGPLPYYVDVLELACLATLLADVGQMYPPLSVFFLWVLTRCSMSGPRRLLPVVIGTLVVLVVVPWKAGIPQMPSSLITLPVVAALAFATRALWLRVQEQDRRQKELLGDVLRKLPYPVLVIAPGGDVVLANPAASELTGPLELLRAYDLDGLDVDLRTLTGVRNLELRLRRGDGGEADVLVETVPDDRNTIVALRDVTAQRQYEHELRHAAHYDALTGLANRALLWQRLNALARSRYAVLLLDLNGFKPVNDELGHQAGDELLRGVAQRIQHACGAYGTAARLGGDEFAVLLPGGGLEEAQAAEAAVRSCFDWDFPLASGPVRVGASIGYAVSAPGYSPDEVLAAADAAMYRQKRSAVGF